jgi:hypothetical protein
MQIAEQLHTQQAFRCYSVASLAIPRALLVIARENRQAPSREGFGLAVPYCPGQIRVSPPSHQHSNHPALTAILSPRLFTHLQP